MWEFFATNVAGPALVAFFVSVVLGSISEGSKRRQEFKLVLAARARLAIREARDKGAEYRGLNLSANTNAKRRQIMQTQILGLQSEAVSAVTSLSAMGFEDVELLDDFVIALTGGDFDTGKADHLAAQAIVNSCADLTGAISNFEICVVQRPILEFLMSIFLPRG